MHETSTSNRRTDDLTRARRAGDVVSALLYHLADQLFGETAIVPPPFRWSDYGTFGVTLFFALSGFTLYISYGASVLTDMRKFFVCRVCRIYPAFVVSPIAYLVVEAASN